MNGAITGTVSEKRTTAWRNISFLHNSSPKITRLLILAMKCVIVSNTGMLTVSERVD